MSELSRLEREDFEWDQISHGNVPGWMRKLVPVQVEGDIEGKHHQLVYYVLPDYLAMGADTDYFQTPMTPVLAQRIADLAKCTLPTRLMVKQIWSHSTVRMVANTFNPTNYVIHSLPVFVLENESNRVARMAVTNIRPMGELVSGDKKDIIISSLIYERLKKGAPKPVVIYGWIQPNGLAIQPAYNGHGETYMDYSHGTRLVQRRVVLDGAPNSVENILKDPVLWSLLSDEEGPMQKPFYGVDTDFFVKGKPPADPLSPAQ